MKTIKIGSSGTEVKKAQSRLQILGYYNGKIDGIFGPITKRAVADFQRANNLVVDGIVGPITWGALDTNTIPVEPAPSDGDIPRKPRTNSEAAQIFGNTKQRVESQLRFCEIPDVFTCFGTKNGKRGFTCHRLLVGQFQKVFNEIAASGLAHKIYSYEGCYNWRKISGSNTMSLHSYAIAIDLNYEGNELGDPTPAMDRNVVAIFKKHGFFWGGDYRGRKDGMHFEWYDRS